MDISQHLIFLLIFTCPGFMIQKFLRYVKQTSYPEMSDFDKNIQAIVYSFLVFFLNMIMLLTFSKSEIDTLQALVESLNRVGFLLTYISLTIADTVAVAIILMVLIHVCMFWIRRKFNKSMYNLRLLPYPTVWENIRNLKIDIIPELGDMCVEIIKNGMVVTQGSIHCFSSSTIAKKDFLLTDVEAVKIYLENDKITVDEFKMFPKILYEYYDAELDVLIRFYDTTKWVRTFGSID